MFIFSNLMGWVTNILCHYEGVGHVFLRNRVFISSGPAHPVLFEQPLNKEVQVDGVTAKNLGHARAFRHGQ